MVGAIPTEVNPFIAAQSAAAPTPTPGASGFLNILQRAMAANPQGFQQLTQQQQPMMAPPQMAQPPMPMQPLPGMAPAQHAQVMPAPQPMMGGGVPPTPAPMAGQAMMPDALRQLLMAHLAGRQQQPSY